MATLSREILGDIDRTQAVILDRICAKVALRLKALSQNLRLEHLVVKKPERIGEYDVAPDRSNWSLEDQDKEDANGNVAMEHLYGVVAYESR